ncbi:DUF1203 domain-containing protein [Palleronia caenipelagi]|uniref:DUF1203 domain-containing protein n=1 Tax=Palleronia caenipelagi TaxID=2489174 RepID=UPI001FE80790|nr:DUF1203 domain-containing protein [Palleronia caenipelagi]
MDFQILPLQMRNFEHLFGLSDADLSTQRACRQKVTETPGTPCRVSLADAEVGETVILVNYTHLPAEGPYNASHVIFIRQNAPQSDRTRRRPGYP